jgi:hypothetical protein
VLLILLISTTGILIGSTTFIPGAFAPTFTPNTNGCYYMILSTVGGCNVTSNVLCITNVGLTDLNSETYMDIYGNPGNNPWLALETATPANEVNVAIIDLYGRVISSTDLTMPSGEFVIRPDCGHQLQQEFIWFVFLPATGKLKEKWY